jgi:hypothetical protein
MNTLKSKRYPLITLEFPSMEELVTKNEDEKNITTCNFLPFDVSKIH